MIVFPTEDWNTFVSMNDMTTELTQLGVGNLWDALDDTKKEELLHKSTSVIKSVCYVRELSKCPFADGQVLLVQSDLLNNGRFLSFEDKKDKYKSARINKIDVVYNIQPDFELPRIFRSLMSSCLKSSNRARGFNVNSIIM